MASLIITTLAYPFLAWYFHRKLDDFMEPGMLRKLSVFLAASIVCWVLGSAIDWAFPAQAIHLV